jgi:hypothetical protein
MPTPPMSQAEAPEAILEALQLDRVTVGAGMTARATKNRFTQVARAGGANSGRYRSRAPMAAVSGVFAVDSGAWHDPFFAAAEPFSEREAWIWLNWRAADGDKGRTGASLRTGVP